MNSRFDTLETRISNLEVEQKSMREDITSIQETMVTKDDVADMTDTVKRIEKTQETQDHILDVLSEDRLITKLS